MRLQKYLSSCGICSRRQGEEYIRLGRVTVNGVRASVGDSVEYGADEICFDGVPVVPAQKRTYIMLHKPRGYVTTLRDPQGRPTVAELTAGAGTRLFPVGRLDYQSEGLLIMTDDGETAQRLAHPSHAVEKTYRVWVRGKDPARSAALLRGEILYRGERYRADRVDVRSASDDSAVLDVTVHEGKKREVRNMCAWASLRVERLVRVRLGELTLGDLPCGEWRYLTEAEQNYLKTIP